MSDGNRFLDKCLATDVTADPWPHQILQDTLSDDLFKKLQQQCEIGRAHV